MSIANKYNKGNKFTFKNTEGYEYKSLKDLYTENSNRTYKCLGMYLNTKGLYGVSPVLITDSCYVNCPQHLTQTVQQMLLDAELIDAVNNGKFGFTIYSYENEKYNKTDYSVNWVDL